MNELSPSLENPQGATIWTVPGFTKQVGIRFDENAKSDDQCRRSWFLSTT
ncbi:hypothetical protein [Novipirellula aureliae]|nr:hypothetical protein [Novipirellula aureliae]